MFTHYCLICKNTSTIFNQLKVNCQGALLPWQLILLLRTMSWMPIRYRKTFFFQVLSICFAESSYSTQNKRKSYLQWFQSWKTRIKGWMNATIKIFITLLISDILWSRMSDCTPWQSKVVWQEKPGSLCFGLPSRGWD